MERKSQQNENVEPVSVSKWRNHKERRIKSNSLDSTIGMKKMKGDLQNSLISADLQSLPLEMLETIAVYLPRDQLVFRFGSTCKKFFGCAAALKKDAIILDEVSLPKESKGIEVGVGYDVYPFNAFHLLKYKEVTDSIYQTTFITAADGDRGYLSRLWKNGYTSLFPLHTSSQKESNCTQLKIIFTAARGSHSRIPSNKAEAFSSLDMAYETLLLYMLDKALD